MDWKQSLAGVGIALAKGPPESVDAGSGFSFSVRIVWPAGTRTDHAIYLISEGERKIEEGTIPEPAPDGNIDFNLRAPEEIGKYRWDLIVSSAPERGSGPIEGRLLLAFATVPHSTSLAVWDIPSPVIRGARFEIKIGGKCSASCRLAGSTLVVRDEAGRVVGKAALGDETLPETTGLYWTSLALRAPNRLKLNAWSASFSPSGLKPAHAETISGFSFVTVAKPEHAVFVKVLNKETKAPIANAQVRLGLYRAVTNAKGAARVNVASGDYPLVVTRAGYEMPEQNIHVSKDVRVRVTAQELPEEDPFALWTA